MSQAVVPVVLFAQVGGRATGCMTCNIHIEAEVLWPLAGSIYSPPMRLAHMYGVVAALM